jgi:hypothetical protein
MYLERMTASQTEILRLMVLPIVKELKHTQEELNRSNPDSRSKDSPERRKPAANKPTAAHDTSRAVNNKESKTCDG